MFNFLSKETFKTEKELILFAIRGCTSNSNIYSRHALNEWKKQYTNQKILELDEGLILHLAKTSNDEEILRAIYDNHRHGFVILYISEIAYPQLYFNVHLPNDLIDCYINSGVRLETLSKEKDRLERMLNVGFNPTVNEKIHNRINEIDVIKRKIKEDKTKDKLKAFLITADATKSVLTGSSIDDVVDGAINETINDGVLDYMNKLLGEVK